MTREEAINSLQGILEEATREEYSVCYVTGEDAEAIEMALKALEHPEQNVIAVVPCGDAISRQAAIEHFQRTLDATDKEGNYDKGFIDGLDFCINHLSTLPSVTPKQRTCWIPLTYRPMTDEEKKYNAERTGYDEEDFDIMLNCQLPEDGETVLITDRLGNVEEDTFINDCDGCYFECNCDIEDVIAWMPLPEPYKEESEEQADDKPM